MSTCAFCPGPLLPTFSDSLPRERCGRCASVWIEGDALIKVMGGSAAEALVRRARGKHGLCKDCQAPLAQVIEWLSRFWSGRLQTLKALAERKQ